MTRPELLEHLDGLRRVKDFSIDEDSAVRVVVRFSDPNRSCAEKLR
ncbi:hypothetical protein MYSE111917_09835 [Mycobacterium senriense]|nr:hypothetical protein [Mycobacterium senriense]